MSRRRRQGEHSNHERWLVSYADFITLLFAFFVVLYASSQVDKVKMGRLASAIEGAFQQLGAFQQTNAMGPTEGATNVLGYEGIDQRTEVSEMNPAAEAHILNSPSGLSPRVVDLLKRDLERALAAEINRRDIALRVGPEGLVVSLREVGFFDSGSASLKPGSEPTIQHIAQILRERGVALRVEGHTDNVPIHTAQFTSNWELSTARATEMIKVLISRYKFPPQLLSAAGYGEFHPVASNDGADGRRQNRRVDLVIFAAQTKRNKLNGPGGLD